jgi:polyisoprenoid-binding protein YceI
MTLVFTLCTSFFLACNKEEPKMLQTQQAKAVDSSKTAQSLAFTLDTAKSRVIWEGSEGLAQIKGTHVGTFNLERGSLTAREGSLVGGTFAIDIRSLKNTDIKSARLRLQQETHLKSPDFFDAEKFPTATFDVTNAAKHSSPDSVIITGNLTMKGVSKSISFPAKVSVDSAQIQASAKFYINRKDWGMNYRTEQSLGDELIRPEVGIGLEILARR